MKYITGIAKEQFLQHMYDGFPTVFNNTFSRTMLENIVEYGVNHHTVSKNGLYYYLRDMIPEVGPMDLIPYIDKELLTDEVLVNFEDCHCLDQTLADARARSDKMYIGEEYSNCKEELEY